ncbi:MAG: transcriptional repressor [Opitutae bacterium]|nr:transcriptional repressor [Opitutae bacterium]
MIASTQTNHPLAAPVASPAAGSEANPLDLACARLRTAGLRITQPRVAILAALLARRQPTSIEQIHRELNQRSCDLVTVYRCLAVFEELGLVRRSFAHNGTSLYAIQSGNEARYHIVCKETQATEELEPAIAADLQQVVQRAVDSLRLRGYRDINAHVEFFGVTGPQHPARTASPDAALPRR